MLLAGMTRHRNLHRLAATAMLSLVLLSACSSTSSSTESSAAAASSTTASSAPDTTVPVTVAARAARTRRAGDVALDSSPPRGFTHGGAGHVVVAHHQHVRDLLHLGGADALAQLIVGIDHVDAEALEPAARATTWSA
jgi:hypothetical protein